MDYMYANFQVNRLKNGSDIVQKLRKCPWVKFSDEFFFTKVPMQHRKMKIAPLNSPSNYASKESFFWRCAFGCRATVILDL